MITVKFYTLLRLYLRRNEVALDLGQATVGQVLAAAQAMIATPFVGKLLDHAGTLKAGTIILVNGRNIIHMDELGTVVSDGDVVALFPPGGGG